MSIGGATSATRPERRRTKGVREMRAMRQMSFAERPRKDGGKRQQLGRRPGARPNVRHRPRPAHAARIPLHVTMRAVAGLPSFRSQRLYRAFESAVRRTRRPDFRIVEYSIQDNHLHLIVEADSREALATGMKSFSVRANRLFNAAAGRRRGRVWGDRYHWRDLTSPRQVRHALVYCLNNYKKHHRMSVGEARIDPCSSARWFGGWSRARTADDGPRPTAEATQFLLTTLWWHKHGRIDPGEAPRLPG